MRGCNRSTPDPRHAARTDPPPDSGSGLLLAAIGRRMAGPGGYYNAGNLVGLGVGIGVPLASTGRGAGLAEQFAGNPGALAISGATLVFLASGELYHRAWERTGGPDPFLNRLADLVAGVGALMLGFGLLMFGHVVLAAAAGGLLALGKFGSAFRQARDPRSAWPDPFRLTVIAGRFPAVLASGADVWRASFFVLAGGSALTLVTPGAMLVCQLLWARADLLLFRSDATASPDRPVDALRPAPIRAGTFPV